MENASPPPTPAPSPVTTQRLQRLHLLARLPERHSERPRPNTALKNVDPFISCEAITRSDTGQSVYLLGVYYKFSQRRIPVAFYRVLNIDSTTQRPLAYPDILVERTFHEFRRLRDAVYEAAAEQHGPCKYCRAMIHLTQLSVDTPHRSIQQLLQKPGAQCSSLSRFLQELIQLAVQTKLMTCSGQRRIPEIVCEFLQILELAGPARLR